MELTPELFRDVLGRLAGGVSIVTTRDGNGQPRGFTATAVCSVSLEPPLVLVCVGHESHTLEAIRSSGFFALNLLDSGSRELSDRFASAADGKFGDLEWWEGPHGSPLLAGDLAWVECDVEQELDAGDHSIVLGRVLAVSVEKTDGEPLVHYLGRYRTLQAEAHS